MYSQVVCDVLNILPLFQSKWVCIRAAAAVSSAVIAGFCILWCFCVWQPSYQTRAVSQREDGSAAHQRGHSSRSQLSAAVPLSTMSSGPPHPGESVTTSSAKSQPASARLPSQSSVPVSVSLSDQQPASQQLPPSGKQRLICSVEVPGIGRAAKVNNVKYVA